MPTNMEGSDRLLDVRAVANRLSVSARAVWKWAASGRLPSPLRVSRSVRWRESDIDRWIRAGCPARAEFETVAEGAAG